MILNRLLIFARGAADSQNGAAARRGAVVHWCATCLSFAAVLLLASMVAAQPKSPEITQLKLTRDPDVPMGQIAVISHSTDRSGARFVVSDLSILQPVAVAVVTRDPSKKLRLELSKFDWNEPDRSGTTDPDGVCSFKIRTQGDMRISVKSEAETAPYALVVWAGDEIPEKMDDVLIPMADYRKQKNWRFGSSSSAILLSVIAVLLLGVFFRLGRIGRKGGPDHAPH